MMQSNANASLNPIALLLGNPMCSATPAMSEPKCAEKIAQAERGHAVFEDDFHLPPEFPCWLLTAVLLIAYMGLCERC